MLQSAQKQWCGHKSAARRFCKYSAPKLAAALLLVGAALWLLVTVSRTTDSTDAAISRIMQQRADEAAATPTPTPRPAAPLSDDFVVPKAADVAALQGQVDSYDPRTAVAFAIPVGGRTQRAKQLAEIISTLIAGGAPPANIFVMEDLLGRPGAVNSPAVGKVAREAGVHLVSSRISRDDMPENQSNFGIHLARHYKFMLDYLLVGPAEAGAIGDDLLAKGVSGSSGPPFQFAVLIEDDLVLAPDFVKYFAAMSRVMKVDPTLYCVSAHQDNAFPATCGIEKTFPVPAAAGVSPASTAPPALDPLNFDFRRGNHFMAPGWMTSAEIYRTVVRDHWLDAQGQYAFKAELHLRNGHWDRFFDSLIGKRDCIFPEVPRIIHQGADGFTVDQKAQMELYSNLKLSALPPSTDYGDLHRMTRDGYIQSTLDFIGASVHLTSLEESRRYRNAKLVYLVENAHSDKDEAWNAVLNGYFGLIGVGGYGGYEGYVKVRGIFGGAVFVRWLSNLILLVGDYSQYAAAVRALPQSLQSDRGMELTNLGCFADRGDDRDLPFHIAYYTAANLSPRACLGSCIHQGYKYAGIQAGMECWCGHSFGKHGSADVNGESKCTQQCARGSSSASASASAGGKADPITCGGSWSNSVYWNHAQPHLHEEVLKPPSDALFVLGGLGQSCTEACARQHSVRSALGQTVQCSEALMPLLHRHCAILQSLVGCTSCREEEDMTHGIHTPGGIDGSYCSLSKGRYLKCAAKPDAVDSLFRRACVCEVKMR